MTKHEAFLIALAAISLIVVGTTWLFGPWALVASGLVLLVGVALIDGKE